MDLEFNALSNLMLNKLDHLIKQTWQLMLEQDEMPDSYSIQKFIECEACDAEELKCSKI